MNGYGTVEKIYRPLGIGVIKSEDGKQIIFTAGSVQGGEDGFEYLTEGDPVNYRTFDDEIGGIKIARDVWPKSPDK